MNNIGPAIEQTTPTRAEIEAWISFAVHEVRADVAGQRARAQLVQVLIEVAADTDGWCDCTEHCEVVSKTCKRVWREPYS